MLLLGALSLFEAAPATAAPDPAFYVDSTTPHMSDLNRADTLRDHVFAGQVGSMHDVPLPSDSQWTQYWRFHNAFVCPWNPAGLTDAWSANSRNIIRPNGNSSAGNCYFIRHRNQIRQFAIIQTMIDNGGVVVALTRTADNFIYGAIWVSVVDVDVPEAISTVTVTPGDRRLTLRWTALDLPGAWGLSGYEVQYRHCEKPRTPASPGDRVDSQGRPILHGNKRIYDVVDCTTAGVPWTNHGAWAGSHDPIARRTTRVIDGLIPGVAYEVRVRARAARGGADPADRVRGVSEWVNATGTPAGVSNDARLRQLDIRR